MGHRSLCVAWRTSWGPGIWMVGKLQRFMLNKIMVFKEILAVY
jgi:hypothetical protein